MLHAPQRDQLDAVQLVSILTDPLGPVLHAPQRDQLDAVQLVSILTDPLGPVLLSATPHTRAHPRFNPHRPVRAGASLQVLENVLKLLKVSILTDPLGPVLQGR